MPNVSNLVKTIQDIMRKDAGTYGDAQRLEQLGWMFFLKIFDDREKEIELLRDTYKSPLPEHLRWSNWAADEEGIHPLRRALEQGREGARIRRHGRDVASQVRHAARRVHEGARSPLDRKSVV